MRLRRTGKLLLALTLSLCGAARPASAAHVTERLGISQEQAAQNVLWSLVGGYAPGYPVSTAFKAAAPAERAELVRDALAWAKVYVASAEFQAAYAKERDQARPAAPEPKGSVDEELGRQRAEQRRQIEEMRKNAEQLPPEQRKAVEDAAKQVAESVDAMEKDEQMQQLYRSGLEAQRADEQRQYEEELKRWEERYPEDPRRLLAQRLRSFLELSADVDFEAQLVSSGGRMKFARPEYEAKDANWKLCFRAGKEAVTATRDFATAWLAELPQ